MRRQLVAKLKLMKVDEKYQNDELYKIYKQMDELIPKYIQNEILKRNCRFQKTHTGQKQETQTITNTNVQTSEVEQEIKN